ncbi:MAG: hypothetical protein CL537_07805 [Alcanivoracaceae bacterium]|nr:hypothetical protein [Alcanivoracaceae bacterium]
MKIEISDDSYSTIVALLAMAREDKKQRLEKAKADGMPGFQRLLESQLREISSAHVEMRKAMRGRRHD